MTDVFPQLMDVLLIRERPTGALSSGVTLLGRELVSSYSSSVFGHKSPRTSEDGDE